MGDLLLEVAKSFEKFSFSHVFRGLNQKLDRLSKEGQSLDMGSLCANDVLDGVLTITTLCFKTS
jgi:hypothetical protein